MDNKHFGSTFDSFLEEEGILEEVNIGAVKKILALQIQNEMKAKKITKTLLAKQLNTSRAQVDRLLDPDNTSITLFTLFNTAKILNKKLEIRLI